MITQTDLLITVGVASFSALMMIPCCYVALRIRRKDMAKRQTVSAENKERMK